MQADSTAGMISSVTYDEMLSLNVAFENVFLSEITRENTNTCL